MIPHIHPEGEPTPTVRELAEMRKGYAVATDWNADGKPTKFHLTPEGQEYLSEIARRNAAATLARGSAAQEAGAALVKSQTEGGSGNGSKGKSTPS